LAGIAFAWGVFAALSPALPEPKAATPATFHPLGLTPAGADLAWTLTLAVARAHAFAGLAVAAALIVAIPLGLLAGLRRNPLLERIELWFGRVIDSLGAFVIVAATLAISPGLSVFWIAIALGLVLWTAFVGMIRLAVIHETRREYFEAAVAMGLPRRRLLWHYLLPAIWRRLAPAALGVCALLVGALGAVDFLGLGAKREVSVGYLLYDSLGSLVASPGYFAASITANLLVVGSLAAAKERLLGVINRDSDS
jgi:ABC-type dipeptide/oligopeptide/nickel transport system permease subunit